jgi:oxygen-independent coproporphyrinogen-3 oxidase
MTALHEQAALIKKYDVPVPRYTSYPTMPYWDTDQFDKEKWIASVKRAFHESNDTAGISLYIHLPFCESLCTYCACNTRITRNHKVEIPYIQAVLKEWEMYRNMFGGMPQIREVHLGGGTPTFFRHENLKWLMSYILEGTKRHKHFEFSFEGHPNNTSTEHLQTLYNLGSRRVSFGVQDLDEKVQRTINRIQPFENLERVTKASRDTGFTSISFDLIYGLPFQTVATITNTIEKVLLLRPDRVAFYSYAHVPWLKPGQRGYEDADIPTAVAKRQLYETGRAILKRAGYHDIGMDHFALASDALYDAQRNGKLHRNFMGYTTNETDLLVGLGTSAISDAKYAYAQNLKKVEDYTTSLAGDELPVFKGHIQTAIDLLRKGCIMDLACGRPVTAEVVNALKSEAVEDELAHMRKEGIVSYNTDGLYVTKPGRTFIRNVCNVFDLRMKSKSADVNVFSKAI